MSKKCLKISGSSKLLAINAIDLQGMGVEEYEMLVHSPEICKNRENNTECKLISIASSCSKVFQTIFVKSKS